MKTRRQYMTHPGNLSTEYVVFDDAGELAAQGDDLEAAMAATKAKRVKYPALVDLEPTRDRTYVF